MKTNYSRYTLSNGMRVILVPVKGSQATSVFVYSKVGSRNETRAINGGSHFVEHLMFKGTPRRPTTLAISQELEGMGAEFNAFTGKDYTGYYIKAASKHTKQMTDVLSDLLFESLFDPKEMNRERTVIIEEIKMYKENPMMHIEDFYEQVVFEGSPLGWSIAGPATTIEKVSRNSLVNYKETFYHPSNMVVVISGGIPKNTKALVKKYFASHKDSFKKQVIKKAKKQTGKRKVETRKTEQTQLAIGFQALHHNHKDLATLELMSAIIGGSMSSRLFIQVRERKGLCYYIKSDVTAYDDAGLFSVYAGVASNRLQEAIEEIKRVLVDFKESPVDAEELNRAKEYMKGKLILRLEASEKLAQWFGQEELFMKKIATPEERMNEIEKVSAKDIKKLANTLLIFTQANAAAIGPVTEKQFGRMFRSW